MAIQRSSVISTARRNAQTEREVSEFDGGWLNIGVNATDPETGEPMFVRLPLGVAVSDLAKKKRKLYASTIKDNPAYAARVQIENAMIDQICEAFLNMGEGESLPTDMLDVQLYRKNEEVDADEVESAAPAFSLFG